MHFMCTYIIAQEEKCIPANTPELWVVDIHATFREELLELPSLFICMTGEINAEDQLRRVTHGTESNLPFQHK